jgi:Mg-chelatase subunit ChlD/DNA-binding beta-propeller fold protein YncE
LGGAAAGLWTGVGTPAGVAVAPDGRVVVTDVASDKVRVLAPDGSETASWGGSGDAPGQLDFPAGVHVSNDGTVWVADRGNGRVVGTTLDGTPRQTIRLSAPQLSGAEPLDVSSDGDDLWVATQVGLVRFSIDGGGRSVRSLLDEAPASGVTVLSEYGLYATVSPLDGYPGVWRYHHGQGSGDPTDRWGGPITVPGFFDKLEALAIGDDDRAYLLDVPPRIQRLTLAGVVDRQLLAEDPEEVDADASGTAYAVGGDQVSSFAADGAQRWQARIRAAAPGADVGFAGVGWDEVNQTVVALDSGGRRLHFLDASGAYVGSWTLKSSDQSRQHWTDLAVGTDGVRYALDAGTGQVRGWDVYERRVLELDLPVAATRMDVAADGTVFVLAVNGWAHQLARDGSVLASWDAVRLELGRGSRPVDIAVDSGGRVYVADGAADVVTVYEWDPNAPKTEPPEVESGCEIAADKLALPPEIPLGDEIEVSLVVRGECAGSQSAADIGLLIDVSMDRSSFKAARRAAEHFVDLVNPSSDLVAIQPGVDSSGRLTNDLQFLRRVARRLEPGEEYDLGAAISKAEGELFGRRGRRGVKKVVIVLFGSSRGEDVEYWEWWRIQRAAGQVKRRGAEVFAIAMGRGTDLRLLYDIASSRSHVYQSRGTWDLDSVYARIVGEIKPSTVLEELTITDEIPENMTYVEGSSVPPAALQGRTLVWRLRDVPLAGAGVRYRLRPTEPGEWPTNVTASGEYIDGTGASGRIDFPVPIVRVLAPTPKPSATPLPTGTPTDTPTPRPTKTSTPEPTPTPPSRRTAFLPLALRERCDPKSRHVDVALVLDASTSMDLPTAAGRRKLDAATEATGLFLDALDFTHDQASVITFNDAAVMRQELTRDRRALDAALNSIPTAPLTRIDRGVAMAHAELVSDRHQIGNQRAMIVLSDGYANPGPAETAVAAARAAKEAGIVVFTIGLGDDIDIEALEQMASLPTYFYRAPDAEELAEIYAEIAVQIPCAPSSFWGGR